MSKETAEEQAPTELYDFLYRDPERLASYYAQIWNGRLLSVEESSSESERSEESVKGDVKVVSTESKVISDLQFQSKRTVDMHDAANVDLLLRIAAQRAEKPGGLGALHVFSGTCFFLDRTILKYAGPSIDYFQHAEAKKHLSSLPRQQRRHAERQKPSNEMEELTKWIKQITSMLDMPSGFILRVNDQLSVCGPVKESGLDQPISSLLFRAGNLGLANVFVVGVIEEWAPMGEELDSPMLQAQRQLGQAFFSLLFPAKAVRMIPLAIYRKLPL